MACQRSFTPARPAMTDVAPKRPSENIAAGWAGPAGPGLSSEEPSTSSGDAPASASASYSPDMNSQLATSSYPGYSERSSSDGSPATPPAANAAAAEPAAIASAMPTAASRLMCTS